MGESREAKKSMFLREACSRGRDSLAGGCGEGASDVRVWFGCMDLPEPELEELKSLLSSTERERLRQFGHPSLARRFVVRRGTLRRLLGLGPDVEFELQNGKPSLANSETRFNVSHRGEDFLIGLTHGMEVGLDLERVPAHWTPEEGLLKDNFADSERALIASDPALFWKGWTRKEACIKALGVGLSAPLPSFLVLREDTVGSISQVELEGGLVVSDLNLPAPYVGAVCTTLGS